MLVVVLVRLRILGLGRGLSSSVNSERSSSLVPKAASNSSLLSVDASLSAPEPGGDFVDEAERSALLHFLPCCARLELGTFAGTTEGEVISMGQKASQSPAEIMSSLFSSVL